jgi:hypothetical protein
VWLKFNRARFRKEEQKKVEERRSREAEDRDGSSVVPANTSNSAFQWDKNQFPTLQKVIPTLEVQPSEDLLEFLRWGFVAELHTHMEAVVLQQALVMEGLHCVKATALGNCLMLLHIEGVGDIEAVRSTHKL